LVVIHLLVVIKWIVSIPIRWSLLIANLVLLHRIVQWTYHLLFTNVLARGDFIYFHLVLGMGLILKRVSIFLLHLGYIHFIALTFLMTLTNLTRIINTNTISLLVSALLYFLTRLQILNILTLSLFL